jgi:hypothetical protein
MFQHILCHFEEDDVILKVLLFELFTSYPQDDKALSFVLVDNWGFGGD